MFWDKTGRKERRLPIVMVVNLAPVWASSAKNRERTFIHNISSHGARVHSATSWQLGDEVEVTPVKGEEPMCGEVVYCRELAKDRFFIGLKFYRHIPWSVLQRFNGAPTIGVICAICHL